MCSQAQEPVEPMAAEHFKWGVVRVDRALAEIGERLDELVKLAQASHLPAADEWVVEAYLDLAEARYALEIALECVRPRYRLRAPAHQLDPRGRRSEQA